ncbi:MAG: hypothetical protein VKK59_02665 [Vampirovibrionales bacterium]|nr:hypothetical protein [Vampirovibrionales bacterium]
MQALGSQFGCGSPSYSPTFSGTQSQRQVSAPTFGACTPCDPCGAVLWTGGIGLLVGGLGLFMAGNVGKFLKNLFGGVLDKAKGVAQPQPSQPAASASPAEHVHGPGCNHA